MVALVAEPTQSFDPVFLLPIDTASPKLGKLLTVSVYQKAKEASCFLLVHAGCFNPGNGSIACLPKTLRCPRQLTRIARIQLLMGTRELELPK